MKTSILLLLFVCAFAVTTSGAPQNDQTDSHSYKHPLMELYKKFHSGQLQNTHIKHKQASQPALSSVEHQGWDGENFSTYYKVDHIYQSGRRTETQHYYPSDIEGEWVLASRELYQYESDRLISIVSQIKVGDSFQNDYRVVFTYQLINEQYLLHETIEQYWSGSQSDWINEEKVALIASNGKLSLGESSSWIANEWYTYELFFFEEQGDDLYITYQEPNGHIWMNTERQVFKNYTIDDLYNFFLDDINIIETGSYLNYAELLPDYTGQYWTGTDWLDMERQVTVTVVHWQTGILYSKQISGQHFEEEWITNTELMITYEDGIKSEMVLSLLDDSEQSQLSPVYAESFEYNNLGLVHYIIQKQAPGDFEKTAKQTELVAFSRLILHWGEISTSIGNEFTPVAFKLGNAYPNPFNPSTVIPFETQIAGEITIRIYDMLGRRVATLANGIYPAGSHSVRFDASGLSSGVYYIRMTSPGTQQIRSVTLLK